MNVKFGRSLIFIGGILELFVAIIHFIMPYFINEIKSLSLHFKDFVILGITAIGLCQLVFGSLTIYFGQKLYQYL